MAEYRYINYLEDGEHKVEAYVFGITKTTKNYFLKCFDCNKGTNQCLCLQKDGDTFSVNTNIDITNEVLTMNYDNLDINQLPLKLGEIERTQKNITLDFIVINYYNDTQNGITYIPEEGYDLANKNGIKIEDLPRIIEDRACYPITNEDFFNLQTKTEKTCVWNKSAIPVEDTETTPVIICPLGKKLYIPEIILKKYTPVENKSKIRVDDTIYVETNKGELLETIVKYKQNKINLLLTKEEIVPVDNKTETNQIKK